MSDIPHILAKSTENTESTKVMGLIRLLFLLLILWVLWFMVKNWLRKQELGDAARREKAKIQPGKAGQKIVRCKHCEVHLPEQDALRDDTGTGNDGAGQEAVWFCTQAHKQAWLNSNHRGPS